MAVRLGCNKASRESHYYLRIYRPVVNYRSKQSRKIAASRDGRLVGTIVIFVLDPLMLHHCELLREDSGILKADRRRVLRTRCLPSPTAERTAAYARVISRRILDDLRHRPFPGRCRSLSRRKKNGLSETHPDRPLVVVALRPSQLSGPNWCSRE